MTLIYEAYALYVRVNKERSAYFPGSAARIRLGKLRYRAWKRWERRKAAAELLMQNQERYTHTMNIVTLIAKARERQNVQIAELEQQKLKRRQEAMEAFRERLNDMFGSLVSMLDMGVQTGEYLDSAYAMFGYESRLYRLSMGRDFWYLTRRDTRLEDDDRELPSADFSANYHNDMTANQDAFLLALADLAQQPDAPFKSTRQIDPTPTPRVMDEFEERMIDALRQWMQSAL